MAELLPHQMVHNVTTRAPRKDETDYEYLDHSSFFSALKNGEFIEHIEHGGELYAIRNIDKTKDWVAVVDPIGALQLIKWAKTNGMDYTTIYLYMPKDKRKERIDEARFNRNEDYFDDALMIYKNHVYSAVSIEDQFNSIKEILGLS